VSWFFLQFVKKIPSAVFLQKIFCIIADFLLRW